jgi:uncharacterized damage-inducible protein DinB
MLISFTIITPTTGNSRLSKLIESINNQNEHSSFTKKIEHFNTIADLTQHVLYYIKGLNEFFQKGALTISDKHSFDFPTITCDEDWEQIKSIFFSEASTFATTVEKFTKTQLNEIFVKKEYGTFERNIEATIEHAYYHLGQIVLLRKLIEE